MLVKHNFAHLLKHQHSFCAMRRVRNFRTTCAARCSRIASRSLHRCTMSWTWLLARKIDIKQLFNKFAQSSARRMQHDASRLNKFCLCCSEHDLPASDKIQKLHTALKYASTLLSPHTSPSTVDTLLYQSQRGV